MTRILLMFLVAAGLAPWARPASAHDHPTAERVNYVLSCMRDHPGPHDEMLNKCSSTVDALARDVPLDDFVSMSTAANANSIGGERGSTVRDSLALQAEIRRFRDLQAAAKKSCFIQSGPR